MKTEFNIVADTKKMTVHLNIYQGGKHIATWKYDTIVAAAADLINKISHFMKDHENEP